MQTEADILLNNAQVHETRVSDLRTKIRCYVCGGYGPSQISPTLNLQLFCTGKANDLSPLLTPVP